MGEGIMRGLLVNKAVDPRDITVNELNPERCEYLKKEHGISAVADATQAIKTADMIIVAVNPYQVAAVTKVLKANAKTTAIIMSIAAGLTISTLEDQLGRDKKIVRVMPNTLIQVGNGYSAACINANIDEEDCEFITKILNALGQTMYIKEEMFDTFTAFSCSGPMWLYKTVEALINAGVYVGFGRQEARNIILKNMLGVAQILEKTGVHPAVKIDEMCSPAGVTIEAFKAIEEDGLSATFIKSMAVAVDKANSIR